MSTPSFSSRGQRIRLILGAGLMTAGVSYLADTMVPTLPTVARDFGASAAEVQWLLSAALLGVAAGQLFMGSLSDAFGRRRVFLIGLSCFALFSLLAPLAPTLGLLIGIRFVQGVAVSSAVVLSRAVLGDLFQGREAASAFSLLSGLLGIGPVLVPVLGAVLLDLGGWRLTLFGIGVISVIVLVYVWFFVPESLPPEKRSSKQLREMLRAYSALLRNVSYWSFGVVVVLNHSCVSLFMGSVGFITQNMLHLPPIGTSIVISIGAIGMVATGFVYARLGMRFEPARALWAVQLFSFAAHVALLALVLMGALDAMLFSIWAIALMSVHSIVLGVGISLAIGQVTRGLGAATALLGFLQYSLGGLVMPLGGAFGDATALPLAVALVTIVGLAIVLRFVLERLGRARPERVGRPER